MEYSDLTVDEIELALSHVDANTDREEWARIGMAVKSELGDAGFDVWDGWSRRADNYNQRDARDTWRSIKARGGVGIATLIHIAQKNGYRKDDSQPQRIDPAAAAERRSRREADAQREAEETERRQKRAADDAKAIWDAAQPFTRHDYTDRKRITTPGAVREGTYRRWHDDGMADIHGALLIPIRDVTNAIVSLQAIFPDDDNVLGRDRDYLPGGRKQGCYFNFGKPTGQPGELIMIGEGYATVASAHAATKAVGVVAFDSGNLPDVAQLIRSKLPQARIIMLADDDRFGKKNAGIAKATEAANLVGGLVAAPKFSSDDGKPTDFNDLHLREGIEAVRLQIEAAQAPVDPPQAANDNQPHQGFEWPRPLDVFGIRQPPALPIDIMPGPFQAYITDQSAQLGCDPAIIGIGLIVTAASAITDDVQLQPKRKDPGWLEHPRLWAAIVGDPSTRKSPAISKAVRFIKRIDRRCAEDYDKEFADYNWQLESWKDCRKADKVGAGPEPKKPPRRQMVVEDITVEKLSDVLKDNPRGVLTLKDELTGWFASMDAYKGGGKGASMDRALWLEAYNGGPRSVDRVTRGHVFVPNWSTCILGGIQPDMMRSIAKSMGNDGLLQRFMIVCARPAVMSVDEDPDFRSIESVAQIFEQLAAIQASGDKPVKFTEPAHENRLRIADYALRLGAALDSPHMKAWLGKWDGLFGRLCITYHTIDCAMDGIHPLSTPVTAATAAKVERLMCGFLLHHALHFYNEIVDANDRQDHVRQLARLILARQFTRITKRDITLYWKASQRMEWWQVRGVIDVLCTVGWLEPDTTAIDNDGKPRAWMVNPDVHASFQAHAEHERERRKDASKMLREMFEAYGK